MTIQLLVVDDHEMFRHGSVRLLEGTNIRVVAEAENGEEAVALLKTHDIDAILLDFCMADQRGTKTLKCIREKSPETPVLILSDNETASCVSQAKALGAAGYLSKRCKRQELVAAIRKVAAGDDVWTDDQLRRITGPLATTWLEIDTAIPLTSRQSEVLRHLALGLSTKEIAKTLKIRYDTAKEHVQNTMRKIGVTGRTEAAVWAVRKGLI